MMEDTFVLAEDTIEMWAGGTLWIIFTTKKGSNKYLEFLEIRFILLKEDAGVGSISPDKRLAITLYKLGRGDYNYTIGEMTGYAESTLSCLIKEVCQAIVKILWEEML